jgi:hypothetical protein
MIASTWRFARNGLASYARLGRATRQFVAAAPIADAVAAVRTNLADREINFLEGVRETIFSNPSNPYFRMFQLAGCGLEDLRYEVQKAGLESTLEQLRRSGVYLAHDEFKGMLPIVRHGKEIQAQPNSFQSAATPLGVPSVSSGSRSPGTNTPYGLKFRLYQEAHERLFLRELGLLDREQIVVFPILPSGSGYIRTLRAGRRGQAAKWFAPGGSWREARHQWLATKWVMAVANASGVNVPLPQGLPPSDFSPVVTHIIRRRKQGRGCSVHSMVSSAVRIARAATELGASLEGTVFVVTGESLSPARRAAIEQTGAEVWPVYSTTEISFVGIPCRQTRGSDRVHFLSDSLGTISYRRKTHLSDCEVESLLFTTLVPFSPFVVINLEMDDHGLIGSATCDCSLARIGLTTTIENIFSFGKMTGMGVTLLGTQLVDLLERRLPAMFGGAPGDYQLLESEEAGQYRVTLRISPRVGLKSVPQATETFLKTVDGLYGGRVTTRVWGHAGALRVEIAEPIATSSGKVLPLHLLRDFRKSQTVENAG